MERFREDTQISTSIMKDATGMVRMVNIKGASNSRKRINLEASPAIRIPIKIPIINPAVIRKNEKDTILQKVLVMIRSARRCITETGDTRSIS